MGLRPIRLLLVGALPPPIGGDTRHFQQLVADAVASDEYQVDVINVSRGSMAHSSLANLRVGIAVVVKVIARVRRVDVVSVHMSDRGMTTLGAAIRLLCFVGRRPCIARLFGGSYGDYYESSSSVLKWWIRRCVLSADVVMVETQRMISQFGAIGARPPLWLSGHLPPGVIPEPLAAEERSCKKFVFLGHLWRTKGVGLILQAAQSMPPDVTVDLWGPLDDFSESAIEEESAGRVRYRGVLARAKLFETLKQYHCLLLPTMHSGEGYPGVIFEAFAAGVPVIATDWLAIPEIVDDTCGVLIEPNSVSALIRAMQDFCNDRTGWRRRCSGATVRAHRFTHDQWASIFDDAVRSVCVQRKGVQAADLREEARD